MTDCMPSFIIVAVGAAAAAADVVAVFFFIYFFWRYKQCQAVWLVDALHSTFSVYFCCYLLVEPTLEGYYICTQSTVQRSRGVCGGKEKY